MARVSYYATPLLRSLVHRPEGVILVITSERAQRAERVLSYLREKSEYSRPDPARPGPTPSRSLKPYISGTACLIDKRSSLMNTTWM